MEMTPRVASRGTDGARRWPVVICAAAMVLSGGPARAEDRTTEGASKAEGQQALQQYRQQALGLRFSFWKGMELRRGEASAALGFFGGGATEIFAGTAAALDSMRGYRIVRIAGTAMWVAGLATLLTELVLLAADRDLLIDQRESSIKPLFWAMIIPGGVIGISGGLMMQGANGYLSDAVGEYNRELARRLSGGSAAVPGRSFWLSLRAAFR